MSPSAARPAPDAASPFRKSLAAARANLGPGLALQAFALALLLAYYFHAPTREALDVVAGWKVRWGWRYSLIATAVFGGLIPFLYLRLRPATRAHTPLSHGLFYLIFWAYKGLEVDWFYTLQGRLFGIEPDFLTVTAKVLFDQLIYVPFWATPTALILFNWKEHFFAPSELRTSRWTSVWRRDMWPALIGTWGVWLPAVAIIYSLPATLQIPLFNLVLLFYALLFATLTKK